MLLDIAVRFHTWLREFPARARDERGASAVEYGLLVALIAAVIILIVAAVGSKVSTGFNAVNVGLP